MSDNNDPADPGADPNAARELQRVRADLVKLRKEMDNVRSERDSAITERDDAIKSRDGYKGQIEKQKAEYETKLSEASAAAEKSKADADAALSAKEASFREGLIRANAVAAFTKAGAVSPDDAVKLADLSSVTLADDGSVTGLDEAVTAAKEARGYLFTEPAKPGTATGTTAAAPAPKPGAPQPFNAMKATQEEYEAQKRAALQKAKKQA